MRVARARQALSTTWHFFVADHIADRLNSDLTHATRKENKCPTEYGRNSLGLLFCAVPPPNVLLFLSFDRAFFAFLAIRISILEDPVRSPENCNAE